MSNTIRVAMDSLLLRVEFLNRCLTENVSLQEMEDFEEIIKKVENKEKEDE